MATRYLTIIIIALLISACSTETGRMLSLADSVMEEHPDSALSILTDLDRYSLKGSEIPYFALLYTQAQVKTDVPLDSDSLISIAYAKYGNDTNGDRGIRSNFYTGEIFFNQEKYREAMRYYLTAYEESKRLNNDYWHAKAAERISDLFFFAYNYEEAAAYAQEAARLYNIAGRTRNNRFAIAQLARVYVTMGNTDRAYGLLDSLRTLSLNQHPQDSALLNYIKLPLVKTKMNTVGISETELDSIDFFNGDMSEMEILDAAIIQSQIFNFIDRPEKVKHIIKDIEVLAHSDEEKIHILYARYMNAKTAADYSLALSIVDSMLYYQNKLAEDIIQESAKGAQRDFYSEMSVRNENKSIYLKKLLWLLIGVAVLLIAFLTIIHHFRSKTQQAKLEANIESFMSLKAYSESIAHEKETLEQSLNEKDIQRNIAVNKLEEIRKEKDLDDISHAKVVEKLFKEKWSTLDVLCDQYFGLKNSEINQKDLVTNMEKEVKKIVSKKGLTEIVEAVDAYMGKLVSSLRSQCPFLKDDDVNFLALLYAGFSVRAVCMFTKIKYAHFYVKKSRLIKRIQSSDAPDKSLFIEKLK